MSVKGCHPGSMSEEEVLESFKTSRQGLSSDEAKDRLERDGRNEIPRKRKSFFRRIAPQIFDFVIVLLLIIAVVLALLAFLFPENDSTSFETSVAIVGVIILSWVLIMIQMYSAERSLEALRKIASAKARVKRDGKWTEVQTSDVVLGDLTILGEGDRIPADIRLLRCDQLNVDESSLTGESMAVAKNSSRMEEGDHPIHEMSNTVFMSTVVTKGSAEGVVIAVGLDTEMGKIARSMEEAPEPAIPLQKKMSQLGRTLSILMLLLIAVLTAIQILRLWADDELIMDSIMEQIVNAVILGVVAVPWSFPIITTSVMARGMLYLVKENAIVRRIASIEGLGRVSVICSDKTGTMTKNAMTVRSVFIDGSSVEVSGTGYDPRGGFSTEDGDIDPSKNRWFRLLLESGNLNNNSKLEKDKEHWKIIGDPTEGALKTLALKGGIGGENEDRKKLKEISFDSSRKMMTTIFEVEGSQVVYSKGAFEVILDRCTRVIWCGGLKQLDDRIRSEFERSNQTMNSRAHRTLAIAFKRLESGTEDLSERKDEEIESEMVLLGIVGMIDPPKPGVKEAVQRCHEAGIRVVMITGDSRGTATAIAEDLGVLRKGEMVVEGKDLPISPERLRKVSVFCRASPDQKVDIVEVYRSQGQIIAMTGDGMNDAAAMKNADVGVAMGISGVDVAREASQLILSDDNFSTIVTAVHRGRQIFDNIRKSITYQMFTNLGELSLMFFGSLIFVEQMMTDRQLLFLYFSTHLFPVAALVLDRSTPGIMREPPRKSKEGIISRSVLGELTMMILSMALIGLVMYIILDRELIHIGTGSNELPTIQTMILTFVVWGECFNLFNSLSMKDSLVSQIKERSMLLPVLMALVPVTALTIIMYSGSIGEGLDLVRLDPLQYLVSVMAGFLIIPLIEIFKLIMVKKRYPRRNDEMKEGS